MAQVEAARVIQSQHPHRGAPSRCSSFNPRLVQAKVVTPLVQAWVEQTRDLIGDGIDTGKVWPLLQVAAMAGQCQVGRFVRAAMLFGDDVFDVVREGAVLLSQQAVLAAILSTLPAMAPFLQNWSLVSVCGEAALRL